MIVKSLIAHTIEQMAREDILLNPFGKRYPHDRRYGVWAIAGHGNGFKETTYGRVGPYQFELFTELHQYDNENIVRCRLLESHEYFRGV